VKYAWIREHRKVYPVALMCDVMGVSSSGYYSRLQRKPSQRAQRNNRIKQTVQQVYDEHYGIYGSYKIADVMRERDELESACRISRTWGDAFGYLRVATGRAEVMIDPVMNLWDTAGLQTVIEEAGGKFFDWQGAPTVHSSESIATNAALAKQVLRIISVGT